MGTFLNSFDCPIDRETTVPLDSGDTLFIGEYSILISVERYDDVSLLPVIGTDRSAQNDATLKKQPGVDCGDERSHRKRLSFWKSITQLASIAGWIMVAWVVYLLLTIK